jgi:threonine dehydratase
MPLTPIPLPDLRAAQSRLGGAALRTPLVRLGLPGDRPEIFLKLESLQPIGSFKIRGAANAMALAGREALARGVYTASAGNMAQGVAWCARESGVRCQVIVPDSAPLTKLAAIERLGGETIKVPFDEWWQTLLDHGHPDFSGLFVHPFADPAVMAGNGTIGLEVAEAVEDIDAILVPFGGGGLICGIASAVLALGLATKVYAVEAETAAPLTASRAKGAPESVNYTRTFIDGMGSKSVSAEMWPLLQLLIDGTVVVSVRDVASAIKLLAERSRIVAEGAGASPVAAALGGSVEARRIVCIVSGGNIDAAKLAAILQDEVP